LQVEGGLADKKVQIIYRIVGAGYDPTAVPLNGKALAFTREVNPYRTGVPRSQWQRCWSG
jgi:hypothetical protein